MGQSSTKEERQQQHPPHHRHASSRPLQQSPPNSSSRVEAGRNEIYNPRQRNGSRPELLTVLSNGNGNGIDKDTVGLENRRESKAEREARKLEKERAERERERQRSMREETVDGGYLVTQGVYTGTEDFNKAMVRHLMVGFVCIVFRACADSLGRTPHCPLLAWSQRSLRLLDGEPACGCRQGPAHTCAGRDSFRKCTDVIFWRWRARQSR